MKQTSAMVTGHMTFNDAEESARLNDCPRRAGRGRPSCAECFLHASLDVLAPVRPSSCARRQFMQLVVAPTLWDAGLGLDEWFEDDPSATDDPAVPGGGGL